MSTQFKLVVCGGGGVGKSCITIRYVYGKFIKSYDPTIEDYYKKSLNLDDQSVTLHIFDTAGYEEYTSIRDSYIFTGDGFIIVYAVDSASSFDQAKELRNHIIKVKEKSDIPIILAANKCDIHAPERAVTTESGQNYASEWNCIFIECSAKEDINISELFTEATKAMVKYYEKENAAKGIVKKKKKSCGSK